MGGLGVGEGRGAGLEWVRHGGWAGRVGSGRRGDITSPKGVSTPGDRIESNSLTEFPHPPLPPLHTIQCHWHTQWTPQPSLPRAAYPPSLCVCVCVWGGGSTRRPTSRRLRGEGFTESGVAQTPGSPSKAWVKSAQEPSGGGGVAVAVGAGCETGEEVGRRGGEGVGAVEVGLWEAAAGEGGTSIPSRRAPAGRSRTPPPTCPRWVSPAAQPAPAPAPWSRPHFGPTPRTAAESAAAAAAAAEAAWWAAPRPTRRARALWGQQRPGRRTRRRSTRSRRRRRGPRSPGAGAARRPATPAPGRPRTPSRRRRAPPGPLGTRRTPSRHRLPRSSRPRTARTAASLPGRRPGPGGPGSRPGRQGPGRRRMPGRRRAGWARGGGRWRGRCRGSAG